MSSKCHNQTCKCTLDSMLSRQQARRTSSIIISSFAESLCWFFYELLNLDWESSKLSDDDEPDNTHDVLTLNQVNGDNLLNVCGCVRTRVVPLFDRLVPLLLLVPADYLGSKNNGNQNASSGHQHVLPDPSWFPIMQVKIQLFTWLSIGVMHVPWN